MHCIFWSLYIIFNIVHDNQPGKPREIKGRLLVYTVLYVKQYSCSEYELIKYEEIRAPFPVSFLESCRRVRSPNDIIQETEKTLTIPKPQQDS